MIDRADHTFFHALGHRTENLIQQAMLNLMKGRTCFVIAHRLSTIIGADRILVMDKGRLVESGTHAELMALGGKYAEMFHRQAENYLGASCYDESEVSVNG